MSSNVFVVHVRYCLSPSSGKSTCAPISQVALFLAAPLAPQAGLGLYLNVGDGGWAFRQATISLPLVLPAASVACLQELPTTPPLSREQVAQSKRLQQPNAISPAIDPS